MGTGPDYECGKTILKRVAENDIDNDLAYAHFLGLIHACIALGQMDEAVSYSDRVPISSTIHDFYGWDSPLKIQLVLEDICSIVFKELSTLFYRDDNRRLKAGVGIIKNSIGFTVPIVSDDRLSLILFVIQYL